MKGIDSKLRELRRKTFADEVEVEDLIEFAIFGDPLAAPVIRALSLEFQWPRTNDENGSHVVPFGRWAEVVIVYLEGGFASLIEYAKGPDNDSFYFATSIMEAIKSTESAHSLTLLSQYLRRPPRKPEREGFLLASAVNLVLSFEDAPEVTSEDLRELREFLHLLLMEAGTEDDRALVVCALRGVGNDESLELIRRLPKFAAPYQNLESTASQAIINRQRRS